MNDQFSSPCRPPVGFVVEGHGEYHCYPSLFSKSIGKSGMFVPRINAGSCGTLIKHLQEQITDLVKTYFPINIVVTVDLIDALEQNLAKSESDLIDRLNAECDEWLKSAKNDGRIKHLPEKIVCIPQILKFESWLVADLEGLHEAGLLKERFDEFSDTETIKRPDTWLKENVLISGNIKSPRNAKTIVSAIRPVFMKERNSSFNAFYVVCNELV